MRPRELAYYAIGVKAVESPKNLADQLRAERDEVSRFVRRCVRAGLPLPEDFLVFSDGKRVMLTPPDEFVIK
jgi:hypothetical protein